MRPCLILMLVASVVFCAPVAASAQASNHGANLRDSLAGAITRVDFIMDLVNLINSEP